MRSWLVTLGVLVGLLYYGTSTDWPLTAGAFPGAAYWYGWFAFANLLYTVLLFLVERERFDAVFHRFWMIGRENLGMMVFVLSLTFTLIGTTSYGAAAALVWLSSAGLGRRLACGDLPAEAMAV